MHVTSVSWVTEVFLLVEEPGERDQALAWSGRRRVHQASWLRARGSVPVGSLGACGAHPHQAMVTVLVMVMMAPNIWGTPTRS